MKLKVFIFLFLSFSISSYANNSLSVMSYNLENFFDTYDDPGKDDKAYLPLSAKQDQSHIDACNKIRVSKWKNECLYLDWSEENKNKKLNNIVATIRSLDTTPDVIAFQEIENINALKDIFYKLKDEGYIDYVLIEGNDYRGIDNAYLSKYKIQKLSNTKLYFLQSFQQKILDQF